MDDEHYWFPSSSHKRSISHSRYLGSLWSELHALETALRIVLCEIEDVPDLHTRLHALFCSSVGQTIDDDPFTKHNNLGDLITMFNDYSASRGNQGIDPEIGEIRHALAHGRVSAISDEDDIRLVNFKRLKGGAPIVCYSAVLTPAWFKRQRKRIQVAIRCVYGFSKTLPTPSAVQS